MSATVRTAWLPVSAHARTPACMLTVLRRACACKTLNPQSPGLVQVGELPAGARAPLLAGHSAVEHVPGEGPRTRDLLTCLHADRAEARACTRAGG